MNNRHASEHAVVVLKWHPPRERNGRLIKYTVVHCRASDGDDPESEEVNLRKIFKCCNG